MVLGVNAGGVGAILYRHENRPSLSAISSLSRSRGILPLSSLHTSASMYPSGATL